MAIEEQLLGRKLSRNTLLVLRKSECVFIALGLIYLGGTLHDAFHNH